MKAIRVHRYGGPEVMSLKTIESPTPGPGEVLVRNQAIGVNFKDIGECREGPVTRLPFTPGVEAAGQIEAVGPGVEAVAVGDRVGYVVNDIGAYAQAVVVPAERLIPLADGISTKLAAAILVNGMTAHYLLHDYRPVTPGLDVLIHGAAGGMGLILVQWAHHLGGRVIGTVSTAEKAQLAKAAGADVVIRYTQQDFVAETQRLTGGKGADLVIDGVGKTTLPGSLEASAKRGQVVLYGMASGVPEPIQPLSLLWRSQSLSGGNLFDFIAQRDDLLRRAQALFEGIQAGWLTLKAETVLPLAKAAEAHRLLESRRSTGKLLLDPTP